MNWSDHESKLICMQLELKYGDETLHLNPPLEYVPWVTVNNKALREVSP